MELSYEESVEAAKPIKEMVELARTLNVEYLTQALADMKKNHSFRESAMILNLSPHTALQKSDLEAEQIKTLDLLIKLAENQNAVRELTIKLNMAKANSADLSRLFGM